MKKLLVCLLLAMVSATGLRSQIVDVLGGNGDYPEYTNSIDSSFDSCSQAWTTNYEWGACIGEHRQMWEDLMLRVYDSLMSELDSTGKNLLRSSQEDWKTSWESKRSFWWYFEGNARGYFGREGHFAAATSEMFEIRARVEELDAYLQMMRQVNKDKKEEENKKE